MNKIINGDCYKMLPTLSDDSIDFIFFSPPYDSIRNYDEFPTLDFVQLAKELYRVAKDGAVCGIVIQDQTKDRIKSGTSFLLVADWLRNSGWKLFETIIYHRHGVPGQFWAKRFRVDHEYIFLFVKGDKGPKYFNKEHLSIPALYAGKPVRVSKRLKNGKLDSEKKFVCADTKCRGTIWYYNTSTTEGNRLKTQHPATFPDKMAEDFIQCFTQKGDVVLDPMCGSGTTCVIANNLNRQYIGIEYSEKYIEIINKRLVVEYTPNLEDHLIP